STSLSTDRIACRSPAAVLFATIHLLAPGLRLYHLRRSSGGVRPARKSTRLRASSFHDGRLPRIPPPWRHRVTTAAAHSAVLVSARAGRALAPRHAGRRRAFLGPP